MPQRSSYGGGSARAGNALQQAYALSGRATLADLPALYGMAGGIGGGGREKDSGGGAFMGQPQAAEGPGPGSGGAGSFAVSTPSQPLPGPFPADTNGMFPSAVNPAFRHQAGEGGNSDTAGDRAIDSLGFGAADPTLSNIAQSLNFGLGLTSGGMALPGLGLQLAADELLGTGSPLPSLTGAYNPTDFLTQEDLARLRNVPPSMVPHVLAQLRAKAQAGYDAQREWNAPAGAPGDIAGNFAPPGTMMGQDIAANRNALSGFARGRGGFGGNANGGGRRGGMGGVGSSRAEHAASAPGGPRGGVGI